MRQTIAREAQEHPLAAAVERGLGQAVVLGAGLDTYAYRSPFRDRLRICEVDHPATQAWKRRRLADAAIPLPGSLTFAPIDFERQTLAQGLEAAGFDSGRQTFFTWLGVGPYLTGPSVWSTLAFIGSLRNGAHVVFDYGNPPDSLPPDTRLAYERRAAHVAGLGEAWLTSFETDELHTRLNSPGFTGIEDLGPRQIGLRYFPDRAGSLPEKGGHILRATSL